MLVDASSRFFVSGPRSKKKEEKRKMGQGEKKREKDQEKKRFAFGSPKREKKHFFKAKYKQVFRFFWLCASVSAAFFFCSLSPTRKKIY